MSVKLARETRQSVATDKYIFEICSSRTTTVDRNFDQEQIDYQICHQAISIAT